MITMEIFTSVPTEKGKTMPNKDVIAYAVDADTGRITWVLYGERREHNERQEL